MAKTVSEGIRRGLEVMSALQNQRAEREQRDLANQIAIGELATKGYQLTPGTPGFMGFGGRPAQLTRDPNFQDWDTYSKQLSAVKTLRELETGTAEDWAEHPTIKGLIINKRTGESKKMSPDTVVDMGDFNQYLPGQESSGDVSQMTDEQLAEVAQGKETPVAQKKETKTAQSKPRDLSRYVITG